MTELCHPVTGVAKSGLFEPGKVSLRFIVDAVDMSSAFFMIRSKITTGLLYRLIFVDDVLSYPVAFEVMDETRRDEQINLEFGLPFDAPAAETGRILLDRIARLPEPTDADRNRWLDNPVVVPIPQEGDRG
jgi:hypothetical protein